MADDDRSRDVLDRRQITEKLGLRTATAREARYWRLIPQITERGLRTVSTRDWRQINVRSRADQVLALAGEGARLVLTARRQERLDALKKEAESLGSDAVTFAGDAREVQTAIQTVKAAVDAFGRLDILINNAGAGNYKNLVDNSAEDYDALMDPNVRSTVLFTLHTVPASPQQTS